RAGALAGRHHAAGGRPVRRHSEGDRMTFLPQPAAGVTATVGLVLAQQPGSNDTPGKEEFGKSSPLGRVVMLLFLVAVVLLVRSDLGALAGRHHAAGGRPVRRHSEGDRMTFLPQPAAGVTATVGLVLAQQPGSNDTPGKEEFGKSSPLGLVVMLLFLVAVVLLVRSMTKHLKRLPESFDEP